MKLYGFWRSSCSWRVRIALAYKGVEYRYEPVNLLRDGVGEHLGDAYRSVNAMAQVPTLEFDRGGVTRRVGQSMAIIELLEELYPAPSLLPADAYLRAKARQLAEIVNSGIQPFQNTAVRRKVKRELGGDDAAFARDFIAQGLSALQAELDGLAGTFCVGDEVTIADIFLAPQLYHARRHGVDMAGLSRLLRIEEACLSLAAFQTAHAERQPDTNLADLKAL
jgi:maleylacetoacetate isomerase